MLQIILGIIISYFIGSIPTAYIFGRMLKGVDIRKFGSGNVGATNAMRVLGKGPGLAVLILDILKGFLAVVVLGNIMGSKVPYISHEALSIMLGMACISGHNWTVFLRFKGGKGVASTFGVLIGLAVNIHGLRIALGLAILTWLLVFSITRIVSLASVLTAITLPVYIILFKQSALLISASIILAIFIFSRHLANLKRIFQGKESRIF